MECARKSGGSPPRASSNLNTGRKCMGRIINDRLKWRGRSARFSRTRGEWWTSTGMVADQKKLDFQVQQDKAAIRGISPEEVSKSVAMALGGKQVGLMHQVKEREDVPIRVQLSREKSLKHRRIARPLSEFARWSDGAGWRTREGSGRNDRQEHLPKKPTRSGLRNSGCGWSRREPRLRN
jgi:hypothetical protein